MGAFALIFALVLAQIATAGSGIPADSNTKLLLHMDGTDGSTTFTDCSISSHTVSANGNAQIDTAQSKFGGASGLFDGNGDYLTIDSSSDFDFSADFTIDFWVRTTATGVFDYFFSSMINASSGGYDSYTNTNGTVYMAAFGSGLVSSTAINDGAWHHIAVARSGSTVKLFVDGVEEASATNSTSHDIARLHIAERFVGVGFGDTGHYYYDGHIDEFRITKGIARWTSNFTPSTSEYEDCGVPAGITITSDVSVTGDASVIGAISKGSGTFVIDHPLFPKEKLLYHSFVESPDVKNLYDGITTLDDRGEAVIKLPKYFLALNEDFRYLATPIGEPMPNLHLGKEVHRWFFGLFGRPVFKITGGVPNGRVSWQITGIRHDPYIRANPVEVEVQKGPGRLINVGECIHPEACE